MPRLAKFSPEQIVATTAQLAARDGPAQATIARIAGALRAPTGSIYHRFASRDVLLGEVWLRAATAFQLGFGAALGDGEPWAAGLAAALYVPARVRQAPDEARVLLLYRREDFLTQGWPAAMARRAAELERGADDGLRRFAQRLLARRDAGTLRAIRYALVDAPLAAVQSHLRAGEPPPPSVDALIRVTYEAVMRHAGAKPPVVSSRREAP
jgi:AcrR family transcriptional regulator